MVYLFRDWLSIPILLALFINFGISGLADHTWAIYLMPLLMITHVTFMAIRNSPKEKDNG